MPPPDWEKVTETHIVEKGTGSKELFGNVDESESLWIKVKEESEKSLLA